MNKRSCNYFAQLSDKSFVEIIHFLVDTNNEQELSTYMQSY